ncbi:MAG: hypothetical protein GVY13_19420 [Alphaproteobacteria bacterium]|jgi:hypothetical protein|nr:hypothetical protein [Alphaproteobacteria bacterium]
MTDTTNGGSAIKRSESEAMEFALEVVSAYGQNGMAVVPTKPSAAMLAAGARAGDVSVEVAWRVYQAMVSEAG